MLGNVLYEAFVENTRRINKVSYCLDKSVICVTIKNVEPFLHNIYPKATGHPRVQNKNGKMFEDFLLRHPHLTVVNSLPICQGSITRSRSKDGKTGEKKKCAGFFFRSLLSYSSLR